MTTTYAEGADRVSDGSSLPFVLPQRVGRSAAIFAVARAYFEAAEKIEARHPTQDIEALRLRCKGAMRIWVNFATIKDECRDISISQRCQQELGIGISITMLKLLRTLAKKFRLYVKRRMAYTGDRWGLRLAFDLIGIKNGTNVNGVDDANGGETDNPDDDDDRYETPQWLFDLINKLLCFTLDAAASATNAKVENYYSKLVNGLLQTWAKYRVWLNPPFSSIGQWIKKIIEESDAELVMALLPTSYNTSWWRELVMPHATLVIIPPGGRLTFGDHTDTIRNDCVLVLFARNALWAVDALSAHLVEDVWPIHYDKAGKRIGALQTVSLMREPRGVEPNDPNNDVPPQYWLEPPEVRAEIEGWLSERGLKIAEFDPCPFPRPPNFDGLTMDWPCEPGECILFNAPFHKSDELHGRGLGEWVKKAKIEAAKGKTIAMYVPMLAASHDLVAAGAEGKALGRVPWLDTATREPWPSPVFTGLFMLDGNSQQGGWKPVRPQHDVVHTDPESG